MTESELRNTIQKAQRADELLNDPLIQEFILVTKGKLLSEFQSAKLDDEQIRLNAWQKSQILNTFLDQFTKTIKEGKDAKTSLLDKIAKATNKLRNVI